MDTFRFAGVSTIQEVQNSCVFIQNMVSFFSTTMNYSFSLLFCQLGSLWYFLHFSKFFLYQLDLNPYYYEIRFVTVPVSMETTLFS